jgi:3' terminal RNA ribose 2'-O-methyltransferase Hen1
VLLTVTTTHRPATDLGFLLHKHPDRLQTFSVPFGEAHVFYPEANEERCTAALLLDIDPVGLVRRGRGASSFALAEYVNDRPYVASSFLSVALVNVFKSAMAGTCKGYEALAAAAIPLEASLPAVPARGGEALVRRLFEPLGYDVAVDPIALDPSFPEWGEGRHVGLRLAGELRLADLLNHLYVLLPVLDDDKHYWVDEAEIEKLMRRGEGWLGAHPERDLIVRRYLKKQARLYFPALAQLDEAAPPVDDPDEPGREEQLEERVSLRDQRLGTVQSVLKASGARCVLDLGCGAGALLERLMRDDYELILGADVSVRALEQAARRLLDRCDQLVAADPDWFQPTGRRGVDVTDADDQAACARWWEELTASGGEGMVVKPMSFIARGRKGLAQPGIKCRGREYLRIIYGPEYADPGQIDRLRTRNLGRKRSLAIREFGLGVEGLERFVRREPLYRVHECVFGVLAMESEPVDPRL